MSTEESLLLPVHSGEHRRNHDHSEHSSNVRVLVLASLLTSFFFFVELIGGYLAGSLAVISDAGHMFSDLASFLISLGAIFISRIKPNDVMSFGYGRAEIFGALISVGLLWALTVYLVYEAVLRILSPIPVNGILMMSLGLIGLLTNIAIFFVLEGHHDHHDHSSCSHGHHHHDHEHNHDHKHEAADDPPSKGLWKRISKALQIEDANRRAAILHVMGDATQNIGVIIAGSIIYFKPQWKIVDPMCTLLFACIVVYTTWGFAGRLIRVLMEGCPENTSIAEVRGKLQQISGVDSVGQLHIWSITTKITALSTKLHSDGTQSEKEILRNTKTCLENNFKLSISYCTIQIDS